MKKSLKILLYIFLIIILLQNKSHAGIQANKGGTPYTQATASEFFDLIRTMESPVGTLGVNQDNGDSKNGIDAHMIKSTEWGTAAMLGMSQYGVGVGVNSIGTTETGNESGVYNMSNETFTTGIWDKASLSSSSTNYYLTIFNAEDKYKNVYSTSKSRINGDAIFDNFSMSDTSPVLKRYFWNGTPSKMGSDGQYYNRNKVLSCCCCKWFRFIII